MTYTAISAKEHTSLSLWPVPAVSRMIRSKPQKPIRFNESLTALDVERFALLVAIERINTLGLDALFIRIRSPSNAPPVLFLLGSTLKTAAFFSGNCCRKRNNSSSTKELLPAPPGPVTPMIGTLCSLGANFSTISPFSA